jgi:hypothetical protein
MAVLYKNNAASTLASGINTTATSIVLASGGGAKFPAVTGSDFFYLTILDGGGNFEIVKVTVRTADTLTVVRAQEGTTALTFVSGVICELRITGGLLDQFKSDTATSITSSNVTNALGFTPYNASNPSGYITGITSGNVTTALGFTPYNATNPNGYISGITSANVTTALGYTPYNSSNPSGYITGITSGMVTTALGFTPYNNSNPSGYITSSALSGYLTSASAASTYLPLAGGTLTGTVYGRGLVLNAFAAGTSGGGLELGWDGTQTVVQGFNRTSAAYTPLWLESSSLRIGINGSSRITVDGNGTTSLSGVTVFNNYISLNGDFYHNGNQYILNAAQNGWINTLSRNGGNPFINNVTYNGNVILHAGNYNSYALPLSGGTLSGILTANSGIYAPKIGIASSNLADQVNGAPWYGLGFSDLNFGAAQVPQFAGYFGLRIRTASTIMDFAPSGDAGNINVSGGGFKVAGNTVLHAGNYSSYALPLSGGTISGQTYISTSGYPLQLISTQRYGLQVRNTNNSVNSGYGWWLAHDANSNFALHADGIGDILTVGRNGSFTVNGNTVLNAGNYNSYSPTLTGGNASGTWSINVTGSSGSAGFSTYNQILDTRAGQYTPNAYQDYRTTYEFTNQIVGGGDWHTAMTMQGWHDGYTAWQIIGPASTGAHENWYLRSGVNTSWNPLRNILHSGNFGSYALPLGGGTLTGYLTLNLGDPTIVFQDTDHRSAMIHVNSNTFYVLRGAGTNSSGWATANGYWPLTINLENNNAEFGNTLNAVGALTQGGNQVLHAGNYSSYALPLSGGSMSGRLTISPGWTTTGRNYSNEWIEFGNHSGLYSPLNGAHFYPNNTEYGSWRIAGSRAGWHGIYFDSGANLMMNSNEVGFHRAGNGWMLRWMAGTGYVHKGNPGGGTEAVILDASNYTSYAPSLGGSGASGTWGISVTGSSGSLSDTSNYMVGRGSYSSGSVDSITGLGVWSQNNVGDSHTVLVFGQGGSTSTVQQRFHYGGSMEFRNRTDSANWTPFKTVLTSANYNSYSPTLTGGNASGTWGINVTGTAGSISGYNNPTTSASANTIAYRDGAGDIAVREIVLTVGVQDFTPSSLVAIYPTTNQGVKVTAGGARNFLDVPTRGGGNASGTWGISITGTARGLDSSHYLARSGSSGNINTDFGNTPAGTMRHAGDDANISNSPGGTWWFYDHYRHSNGSNLWGTTVAWGWEDNSLRLAQRNVSGGGFSGWTYYLNSNNYTSYTMNRGGDTITGIIYFQTNRNGRSGNTDSAALQAYSTGNNSAFMSFHKGGHYATNMGLDDDNVMRIGGWSAAANRWQLDMSGNGTYAGNVTAYSDERLKTNWQPMPEDYVTRLAQVKVGIYDRIDEKEMSQVGVSAQSLQRLLPQAIMTTKDEMQTLSVSYGNAALASSVELAKEVVDLRTRVSQLEFLINQLIGD